MKKTTLCILLLCTISNLFGQTENKSLWKEIDEKVIAKSFERTLKPSKFRTLSLDLQGMKTLLRSAPLEKTERTSDFGVEMQLPMPDGSWSRFRIYETYVMHPDLAAQFPEIKTFAGQGVDDVNATIRLDFTPKGFHAMVLSPAGTVFVDPYSQNSTGEYICYYKKDIKPSVPFVCETKTDENPDNYHNILPAELYAERSSGTQLRTYRLALACTGEYAVARGGTASSAMSSMVTTMNRVDGVYETEVAIRMVIIGNDNLLVYLNGATDPYTNDDGSTMLAENQSNITSVIGSANYDIGHVFSTGGGGIAGLGVVCSSTNKARGVTGSPDPTGDGFDIDYVAHEMGHQFGGNHTFNSVTGNCGGGNRASSAAYEPGSGITVMAYAGICGSDDLAPHSIAYFHTKSFDEITIFSTTGGGNTCAVTTNTGNTAPVVTSMGLPQSIPISTPFVLTGAATDANSDPITYSWEQYDLGASSAWNAVQTAGSTWPLFRPFSPTTSPSRTFPKLSDIINNTTTVGEVLPTVARTLHFRLTVRDNRTGGGGVMHPDTTLNISVVNNGGAFAVTAPNTAVSWVGNSTQIVTWTVNGTTASPINCANVKISLSTDGGNTFPTVISASTANDGTESITVPNIPTTLARIKVEAVGNIFFDMSNVNFTITAGSPLTTITTSAISPTSYCQGASANVPFTINAPANAGNVFKAVLSSASGSFVTTHDTIGTLSSVNAGTIIATIPVGTPAGIGYRIRVVSSSPIVTGSDNGANITVNALPSGTITGSASVCSGSSVQWCAPAGLSSYKWSTGATTQCITVSTAGTYTDTVTNASGCKSFSSQTLTVNPLPSSTITGNASVCSGSSVQWCAPAGLTSYAWSNGATTQCIAVSAAGTYTDTVTNSNGCKSFSSQTLTVNPLPSSTITGSSSVCSGSSVQWCAPAGLSSYKWNTGATTQCITVSVAGTYTDTVTNANGCKSFSSQTLTVNPLPSSTITGSSSVCSGSSVQWCAPSGLTSYAWSNGATTQCIAVSAAGTYTDTVTNANGCKSFSSQTLTVNPLPSSTIAGSSSVCSGNSTQWCAPAGLSSYSWSTGATTQCITVNVTGTYTVTVTNANGCTSSSSKTLTVNSLPSSTITGNSSVCSGSSTQWCAPSGLSFYSWSTGEGTQCITVSAAGTYTVTVTNANGCTSSSSKTLTVNPLPSSTITGNSSVCSGSSAQWCVPVSASYLWNTTASTQCINVSAAGTYTVTVTDANGCTSSSTKSLTVNSLPSSTITGSSSVCSGSSTQWCAPVSTGYLWNTTATTQCINVSAAGTYTVTVTNANGCTSSSTKSLTVNSLPSSTITGSSSVCSGSSTQWCAPVSIGYLWNTTATTQCINVSAAGTYTVTVTDANGCTSSSSKTLTVNSCPVTLSLKMFIEGFYRGNNLMSAVADPEGHPTLCDTITVELHNANSPYNLVEAQTGTLSTNGNGNFVFTSITSGISYYIVIKHRNSVETWSKNPVLFNSSSVNFDFTSP